MGFRETGPPDGDIDVDTDPGSGGSSPVGAGAGAANGPETGKGRLPALLLRWRWLIGITGRCMPGSPYGPGLIERWPSAPGAGDIERGTGNSIAGFGPLG